MRRMERKAQAQSNGFANLIWIYPGKNQEWSARMAKETAEEACENLRKAGFQAKVE